MIERIHGLKVTLINKGVTSGCNRLKTEYALHLKRRHKATFAMASPSVVLRVIVAILFLLGGKVIFLKTALAYFKRFYIGQLLRGGLANSRMTRST